MTFDLDIWHAGSIGTI